MYESINSTISQPNVQMHPLLYFKIQPSTYQSEILHKYSNYYLQSILFVVSDKQTPLHAGQNHRSQYSEPEVVISMLF